MSKREKKWHSSYLQKVNGEILAQTLSDFLNRVKAEKLEIINKYDNAVQFIYYGFSERNYE